MSGEPRKSWRWRGERERGVLRTLENLITRMWCGSGRKPKPGQIVSGADSETRKMLGELKSSDLENERLDEAGA